MACGPELPVEFVLARFSPALGPIDTLAARYLGYWGAELGERWSARD
jgi:hypothetical protein